MLFLSTNGPLNFVMPKYMKFRLSLILRLNAIFTLARHVKLKIMPIPSFKTKCYQILVSKQFSANPHLLYWTFTIWSIGSGQNRIATVSTHRCDVIYLKLSTDQLIVLLYHDQCSISYFLASLGTREKLIMHPYWTSML